MILTVTHLTRMRPPNICAAGLCDGVGVRPVLAGQLHKRLLRSQGGPFAIGAMVDLGAVKHVGTAPEYEDYSFNPAHARYTGSLAADEFWKLLQKTARPSLELIFGEDLVRRGRGSCAVKLGCGTASLGCLQVFGAIEIFIRGLDPNAVRSGLRIAIKDPVMGKLDLGITDVRFYQDDFISVNEQVVHDVQARIGRGVKVLLSVGLTRAFPPDNPAHWLQVNNVHLQDNPLWNL